MAQGRITILGLDLVGASLGAALRQQDLDFEIVGNDRDPEVASAAKQRGDVHRTQFNLHRACEGAGLVIVSMPVAELPELLDLISEELDPGTVILCLSDVMEPVLEYAQRGLPSHVHLLAGHPILTGLGSLLEPRADLFQDVPFCLSSDVETPPGSLELVNNLIQRVGATPLYMDAAEHDGIISLVEHLPKLLGGALVQTASGGPGWRDGKKLAGRQFAQTTDIGENGAALARSLFVNRQNLLRSLDRFLESLAELRQHLAEEDEAGLKGSLKQATTERIRWERQARLKDWDRVVNVDQEEESSGFLGQMFFGSLLRPRRSREEKE